MNETFQVHDAPSVLHNGLAGLVWLAAFKWFRSLQWKQRSDLGWNLNHFSRKLKSSVTFLRFPLWLSWRVWAPSKPDSTETNRRFTQPFSWAAAHLSPESGTYGITIHGTIWLAFYCARCWLLIWASDKFAEISPATCLILWWKPQISTQHMSSTDWLRPQISRPGPWRKCFLQNFGCDCDRFYAWNLDRFHHQGVWRISPFNGSPL